MKDSTHMKIQSFIEGYEILIQAYKETGNKTLISHANSFEESISQLKQMLANGVDPKVGREMIKGLKQGLRETPESISSIVPEYSEKLITEFETRLGCKFSDF